MTFNQFESMKKVKILVEPELDLKFDPSDIELQPNLEEIFGTNKKCGDVYIYDSGKLGFSCDFCKRKFMTYEDFVNHLENDHLRLFANISENSMKICSSDEDEILPKIGNTNTDMGSSQDHKNSLQQYSLPVKEESVLEKDVEGISVKIRCEVCDREFKSNSTLIKHKKLHLISDGTLNKRQTAKRKKTIEDRILKCRYCDQSNFRCPSERKIHERIHTGEKPHKCDVCSKCFRTVRKLQEHLFTHNGTKPHKCKDCTAAFINQTNLMAHVRRKHLNEKPFKCEQCEKNFVTSAELRIHIRSHTGENPYQCEECGSKFNTSSALTIHRNRRHLKIKRFTCEICSKMFLTGSCLKDHKMVHSDEKPFSCTICTDTFARNKSLKSHMKIHSDVKEYVCQICGKNFAQNAGLYSHMKSHGFYREKKSNNDGIDDK